MCRVKAISGVSANHIYKTDENSVKTEYVLLRSDLDEEDANYPDYYDVEHITLVKDANVVGATYLDLLEIVTDYVKQKCSNNVGNTAIETELESVIVRLEQVLLRLENIENKEKGCQL